MAQQIKERPVASLVLVACLLSFLVVAWPERTSADPPAEEAPPISRIQPSPDSIMTISSYRPSLTVSWEDPVSIEVDPTTSRINGVDMTQQVVSSGSFWGGHPEYHEVVRDETCP